MIILGIIDDAVNTSASIIRDGKIIAACCEERLNRQKKYRFFPKLAINYCLDKLGITLDQVDYITHAFNPAIYARKTNLRFSNIPRWKAEYFTSIPNNLSAFYSKQNYEYSDHSYQELNISKNKKSRIYYIDHHLAHAANGYYLSSFKESAILTCDGRGENNTGILAYGKNNKINKLKENIYPHSIALLYGIFTELLGFKMDNDEWKIMALGAYASDTKLKKNFYTKIKNLVILKNDGTYELNLNLFNHYLPDQKLNLKLLKNYIGIKNQLNSDKVNEIHYCIAWAIQKVSEETIIHLLKWLKNKTKSDNLCCSGGFFMNSLFNGKISKLSGFKNIFISSCPDDAGTSIGSSLYLYNHILNNKKRYLQSHNFYGPSFSRSDIEKELNKTKLKFKKIKNINHMTAKLIYEGNIIGWFQDAMEFGDRALGNRSILADPRDHRTKNKINKAIKFREPFRPFAPMILEEFAEKYFELPKNGKKVPFMEKVYKIKKHMRKLIPAVTHNDGTGRLQTITKKDNTKIYELITEFNKLTGVPIILNTSFNINGEPIVCSPADAIKTFYSSGIDYLVMGNFLIEK